MLGRWSSHIILGAVPSVVELLCVAAANAVVVVAQAQSQLGPEHETLEGRERRRARVVAAYLVPSMCVYATILSKCARSFCHFVLLSYVNEHAIAHWAKFGV